MQELSRELLRLKVRSPFSQDTALVFCTRDGSALMRRNTLRTLSKACEDAKLEHVTQHELRHTFASMLIGLGFDVTVVAAQMGHARPDVTLRTYAHLYNPEGRMAEVRDQLSTAFGGMV